MLIPYQKRIFIGSLLVFFILAVSAMPISAEATYAGPEKCKICHGDKYREWETTLHGTEKANATCEACHGLGSEHIAGGGDKTKITILEDLILEKQTEICAKCHGAQYEDFKQSGKHYTYTACTTCHKAHGTENVHDLIRPLPELCTRCHSFVPGAHNYIPPIHDKLSEVMSWTNTACTNCHFPNNRHTIKFLLDSCITNCHKNKDATWAQKTLDVKKAELSSAVPAGEKGICGPTAVLLIAVLPVVLYVRRRRKRS